MHAAESCLTIAAVCARTARTFWKVALRPFHEVVKGFAVQLRLETRDALVELYNAITPDEYQAFPVQPMTIAAALTEFVEEQQDSYENWKPRSEIFRRQVGRYSRVRFRPVIGEHSAGSLQNLESLESTFAIRTQRHHLRYRPRSRLCAASNL